MLELPRSLCIVFSRLCVLTAVELDDESLLETDKINDVIDERVLAPELQLSEVAVSRKPHSELSIG